MAAHSPSDFTTLARLNNAILLSGLPFEQAAAAHRAAADVWESLISSDPELLAIARLRMAENYLRLCEVHGRPLGECEISFADMLAQNSVDEVSHAAQMVVSYCAHLLTVGAADLAFGHLERMLPAIEAEARRRPYVEILDVMELARRLMTQIGGVIRNGVAAPELPQEPAPVRHSALLHVDMRVESDDITGLMDALRPAMSAIRNSEAEARFALTEPAPGIEATLLNIADIVEHLSPSDRERWSRCRRRELEVGIQPAATPHAAFFSLSLLAIQRLHRLGTTLTFTVYADRPQHAVPLKPPPP